MCNVCSGKCVVDSPFSREGKSAQDHENMADGAEQYVMYRQATSALQASV